MAKIDWKKKNNNNKETNDIRKRHKSKEEGRERGHKRKSNKPMCTLHMSFLVSFLLLVFISSFLPILVGLGKKTLGFTNFSPSLHSNKYPQFFFSHLFFILPKIHPTKQNLRLHFPER